jgi:hypothetical protein
MRIISVWKNKRAHEILMSVDFRCNRSREIFEFSVTVSDDILSKLICNYRVQNVCLVHTFSNNKMISTIEENYTTRIFLESWTMPSDN